MSKKVYGIFYSDREYAKTQGDPLLGRVEAESKEKAEGIAVNVFNSNGAGLLALEFHKCCWEKCPGYLWKASEWKHTTCG